MFHLLPLHDVLILMLMVTIGILHWSDQSLILRNLIIVVVDNILVVVWAAILVIITVSREHGHAYIGGLLQVLLGLNEYFLEHEGIHMGE